MVFSSYLFLFGFLPPALAAYYLCPPRHRTLAMTLLSYLFYGWASPWFVLLLAGTTVFDYVAGLVVSGRFAWAAGDQQRRLGVVASVTVNLAMLGAFKYLGFAQENLNWLLDALGRPTLDVIRVALPVGISFYTFQSMSYCIDIYRRRAQPCESLADFACYVSLLPHLVAGPIVRYHQIADQLHQREYTWARFNHGAAFFAFGLAKKVLLANPMGEMADAAWAAGGLSAAQAWLGAVAYAFQIYFDFSGYSDMAVGLGRMMGFELPRNFERPYLADSITDFWRRWHISLSTWLRDYLYFPLGGNRRGALRTYANLVIVMLLGGLWHGAQWTFVAWGALHGAALIAERLMGRQPLYQRAPRWIRVSLTFLLALLAWVLFRSPTIGAAGAYLMAMAGWGQGRPLVDAVLRSPDHLLALAACLWVTWRCADTWEALAHLTPRRAWQAGLLFVAAVLVLFTQDYSPFLYFQF
ncbi:MAG: MBOAT family protein [Armatimonadetes bacterium]|nr:MBOAT family protein [Armatimonadota bacterium]